MPERRSGISPTFIIGTALLLGVGAAISSLAFSPAVRQQILDRDGHKCQGPGPHEGYLNASHIDHTKGPIMMNGELVPYDDARRGLIECLACHLGRHIATAGHNGLPLNQNSWAIRKLQGRLEDYRKENNY